MQRLVGMLIVASLASLAAAFGAGCGPSAPRPVVGQDDITAGHLRNLQDEKSVLRLLEPTQEEAQALAKEGAAGAETPPGTEGWHEDRDLEEAPTDQQKWEQASIAVLQVAVTIGAVVAPFFLY